MAEYQRCKNPKCENLVNPGKQFCSKKCCNSVDHLTQEDVTCTSCNEMFTRSRGYIRYNRKRYNGFLCANCARLKRESEEAEKTQEKKLEEARAEVKFIQDPYPGLTVNCRIESESVYGLIAPAGY